MLSKTRFSSIIRGFSLKKFGSGLLIPKSELTNKMVRSFNALLCNIKITQDLMNTSNDNHDRNRLFESHSNGETYHEVLDQTSESQVLFHNLNEINTIEDVISTLGEIIHDCEKRNDPLGYFAVLYQKVTIKVKEGIDNHFFDDGMRMEQLDIIFAKRYLKAYFAFRRNEPLTASWTRAFELGSVFEPTVVQHLMLGINAHINLDLGIAAAEVCRKEDLNDLKNDFIKINKILSSMVDEVQSSLSGIWPVWGILQKRLGQLDNFLINIIIQSARKGAWKFARSIFDKPLDEVKVIVAKRDRQTARVASIIGKPGKLFGMVIHWIRTLEKGSVADKIQELRLQPYYITAYAKG